MPECYNCGNEIDKESGIFRSSLCDSCGQDLKVCLNCEFYSPGIHWDCRETIEEMVADKDRANFCSWFRFSDRKYGKKVNPSENAKNLFDQLFND